MLGTRPLGSISLASRQTRKMSWIFKAPALLVSYAKDLILTAYSRSFELRGRAKSIIIKRK